LSRTSPLSGRISPATVEISVVLPEPENPTMATNSPSAMESEMSRSTSMRAAPLP
jgi:hypothetical protein